MCPHVGNIFRQIISTIVMARNFDNTRTNHSDKKDDDDNEQEHIFIFRMRPDRIDSVVKSLGPNKLFHVPDGMGKSIELFDILG